MGIWHLTFSSRGRRVLFTTAAGLLEGVHAIARGARGRVVLFSIVDDHAQVVVHADKSDRVSSSLLRALRAVSQIEDPAYRREVENRRHLEWLANRYILEQPRKHGLATHPALWAGSCFLDLIGARRIPGLVLQLGRVLPRYRPRAAFEAAGLPGEPLVPAKVVELRAAGAIRLARAAAASVGTATCTGRSAGPTTARQIAAGLTVQAGIHSRDLANALAIRPNSARRLMRRPLDPEALQPARTWLALEDRVHSSANTPS